MSQNVEPQPFAYLQAPNAALYAQVLGVFAQARERFIVHLRPEDVVADLRTGPGADAVSSALEQLVDWGNLRADADTGRVTSVEDFHRARYLYQLTRHGQAALRAVALYDQALGQRGQLQSVALADIAEQLASMLVLAQQDRPDPAKAHLVLLTLADRFGSLADNAQAFMASLRRTIDFEDGDEEAFIAYKDRLVEYIERFIADLASRGAQIADLLVRVGEAGVERLLTAAAQREAGDAVPGDGQDAQDAARAQREATAAARAAWENRWRGLCDWFLSRSSRQPSQAKLLRGAAVSAITSLVNTVAALNERRGGRSDRSADFRALARFFAQAPDDDAAHRLWRAAFALTPARHLTVDAATEAAWQDADLTVTTPWTQAPPVEISPRLRETGSYERRGQPNRVADRSAARRVLAEQAELEAVQTAAARSRLATDGPVPLSRLAGPDGLDPQAFRLFLTVLGDALSARGPGESESSATTGDGTMEVRLKLVAPDTVIRIPTADGVLSGPEHLLEIIDLVAAAETSTPDRAGTAARGA
ncbi:TIGR02677 family protein [Streptomyces litchfieldiae]|uniref:TIGR02677 family protein n=1 Tax=Streptomyces litchfieldiae TaxID=3075543 RepID=A0ABU2MJT2_9ACTN|nr:TIGR02677 family protein [Streptomyces sp. DSM 44938]MDT0341861.1 TIGR02677 family protein [Streptomyces sp. DSM 44938]